jgi:ubiquinone/menaquinone biosynthesis C-methylase UbiE
MASPRDTAWLVEAMAHAHTRTPDVVNAYYTLCIPFYIEFLGAHWHTGFYAPQGPIGPADQLAMERLVAASARIQPGQRVLDVGCGIIGTACHLAQHTRADFEGLTPNRVQLDMARQRAQDLGLSARVHFSEGHAHALPFEDACFDTVLFFESPCHFPDRPRFFREVMRVLKPGGVLAGEDWLASSDLTDADVQRHLDPICQTWAIPALGDLQTYARDMQAAGLRVSTQTDMRQEMALARGFIVQDDDRRSVEAEIATCQDPIRALIMQSLLHLGDAVRAGAFTLGRFVASKPR